MDGYGSNPDTSINARLVGEYIFYLTNQQKKKMNDGRLAEYLVAADLERDGYPATIVSGREYDIIAETADSLVTVQVKSTLTVKNEIIYCERGRGRYTWRGYKFMGRATSGGFGSYALVDYFAFVALDIESILYLPAKTVTESAMQRIPEKKFLALCEKSKIGEAKSSYETNNENVSLELDLFDYEIK